MAVSADGRLAVTAGGFGEYVDPPDALSPARVFDLADGRCLYSIPHAPWSYPEAVALSPDGRTLATRDDTFLTIREAATGKEIRKLKCLPEAGGTHLGTRWLTFTPDGKHVAVTLRGMAIHLVAVDTGRVTRTFERSQAACACVFSPDGTRMAAGGYEHEDDVYFVRVSEVATGRELRRIVVARGPNQNMTALAFSPDGTVLAGSAWSDGRLRLFQVATGKQLKVFPRIGDSVRSIAFAPDGRTVAAAGDRIHLYDPATGEERLCIDRQARALAFSAAPSGAAGAEAPVLTGAVSGAIYRWDAASGRQLAPAAGPDTAVEQILVSADGRSLFTTDQDGQLHVWDTRGNHPPRRIADGAERGVVASPGGRVLAWVTARDAHGGNRVRLYDVAGQRLVDRFPIFAEFASAVGFLPDGRTLVTLGGLSPPPTVRLWDVATGQERRSFAAALPQAFARLRGAPAEDGVPVRLWDVATGQPGRRLDEPPHPLAVANEAGLGGDLGGMAPRWTNYTIRQAALAPDGQTLALGFDLGKRRLKSMDGRAFSPDGRLLVDWAANPFGPSRIDHLHVWDTATGRLVATPAIGPRPGTRNAAFAPDGRTFAAASTDGTAQLWEVATWAVRAELHGHRDRVTALAFGPDGRLFTAGLDGAVLGWDVRPAQDPARGSLADAWAGFAGADARAGFQAQGRFLAEPGPAVAWLTARLVPAPAVDPARVRAWIADLGSDDFATRSRAAAQLQAHWPATETALRRAAAQVPALEPRRRAEGIVRAMEQAGVPPEQLRALRAAEVLEWIATNEARALLRALARGDPDATLTRAAAAACRRLGEGR